MHQRWNGRFVCKFRKHAWPSRGYLAYDWPPWTGSDHRPRNFGWFHLFYHRLSSLCCFWTVHNHCLNHLHTFSLTYCFTVLLLWMLIADRKNRLGNCSITKSQSSRAKIIFDLSLRRQQVIDGARECSGRNGITWRPNNRSHSRAKTLRSRLDSSAHTTITAKFYRRHYMKTNTYPHASDQYLGTARCIQRPAPAAVTPSA